MRWRRKITGGLLAVVGFMLSPLSWWNDAFVNLPLALGFAWLVSSLCPESVRERVFEAALIGGYWATNLVGFILLHTGARRLLSESHPQLRGGWKKQVLISLGYTALIVVLIKFGVLKPVAAYFPSPPPPGS